MSDKLPQSQVGITHKVFAGLVFVVTLIVFMLTVQRSLSLWDCGEFVACSYILGIAHPPGTPLFLLIGRVFAILPTASDAALRVNLLSVISGAVAATFAYLVAVRLLFFIPGVRQSGGRRLAVYFSAMTGALLFAFGRTGWSNSVEAEVYSLSMAVIFALVWLTLRWFDVRGTSTANRYLVLITYIGLLGVGVHVTVFLVMPAIFLFIILADSTLLKDVRFWVVGVLLFTINVSVEWFVIGLLIWMAISLVAFLGSRSKGWALTLLLATAGLTGFSVHAYVPIRAAEKPSINENNPDTIKRFVDYIARRQYGDESMFKKMFTRRASWLHQLGRFPRIGMGGFLLDQFGMPGNAFLLPLVLVIAGLLALIKWKWRVGVFVTAMLLLFTIGLVVYMNFADGSKIDPLTGNNKLEVRDRDYFFTPGFMLFGLCIGLGVFVFINGAINRFGERYALSIALGLGLLSLLLPAVALSANRHVCDRSGNFAAYNYAHNLLMSCPKDAILFTNGDNDTFPVWCLQEAYGIRKDVRVVNLSLLQIDWYQLQMKYEKGVPISFDDDQMIWTKHIEPSSGRTRYYPARPYYDALRKWTHPLVAFKDQETGQLVSVAFQVIENIIAANKWKYPILFANSYPTEVKYPLAEHVIREGIVYELVREKTDGGFDEARSDTLFKDVYEYRGLDNPNVYLDDVAISLVIGDVQTIMELTDQLARKGDTTQALSLVDFETEKVPSFWQGYARKAVFGNLNDSTIDTMFVDYFDYLSRVQEVAPDNVYYWQFRGMALQFLGQNEAALKAYEISYDINPVIPVTYRSLVSILLQMNRRDEAVKISRDYLKTNPNDQAATAVISGRI